MTNQGADGEGRGIKWERWVDETEGDTSAMAEPAAEGDAAIFVDAACKAARAETAELMAGTIVGLSQHTDQVEKERDDWRARCEAALSERDALSGALAMAVDLASAMEKERDAAVRALGETHANTKPDFLQRAGDVKETREGQRGMSDPNDAIHEIGNRFAKDGWAKCTEGLDARTLDRVWEYRSIQYSHVYAAAQVSLIHSRLEAAAALYRSQQYEKAADAFYSALADVWLIQTPEDGGDMGP